MAAASNLTMDFPVVSLASFDDNSIALFKEYGVLVITDVVSKAACDATMNDIVSSFEQLGTGVRRNNLSTWNTFNLPPQTNVGLFQCLLCNTPAVWRIRTNPAIVQIFRRIYASMRGVPSISRLIVSNDGINVQPNGIKTREKPDWAHVDQSQSPNIFECVQGQVVLTNTTASFVCSPKSHLAFEQILATRNVGLGNPSNWCKLGDAADTAKAIIESLGGQYQIPVVAPAGSLILWLSSLVHSARASTTVETPSQLDPWLGWRGIVYVSYRPRDEYSAAELGQRSRVHSQNRVTNHWGTRVFPKIPGGRFTKTVERHPVINRLLDRPETVFEQLGINPTFLNTPDIRAITS